jgi:predicted TIM-barrel fold metal-dependent hydrolase
MNKIIDIHCHLGDILYGKDIIYQKGAKLPSGKHEDQYRSFLKLALSKNINITTKLFSLLATEKVAMKAVPAQTQRNNSGTIENMSKIMGENNIAAMCMLPVHPYVTFEDLLKASKSDSRIIPFTSIDYSLGKDAGKKLLEDVEKGAKGLKIHPVIQRKSLLDEETIQALQYWKETKKPVQPHLGVFHYYPMEERHLNCPEYGKYEDFRKLLTLFPDIPFIAAHSADCEWKRLIRDGKNNDNLYLELSFSSRVQLRYFLRKWPVERILYGSDWPWGDPDISLKVIDLSVKDPEAKEMILYKNAERLLGI